MAAVLITRTDLSPAELREQAARSKDARITRRLLAIAMVSDGHSRETASEACAMDRQTLCDWVHRYSEHGLSGLADRAHPGPRHLLTAGQEAELDAWAEQGPDLAAGRSPRRPAGHTDARLGPAWFPAARRQGSPLHPGLSVWRDLPGARCWRRDRDA